MNNILREYPSGHPSIPQAEEDLNKQKKVWLKDSLKLVLSMSSTESPYAKYTAWVHCKKKIYAVWLGRRL